MLITNSGGHVWAPYRALSKPIPFKSLAFCVTGHILFAELCHLYFRIYLAKPTYVDPLKYIQNYKRRSKSILAVLLDATSLSEIRIPTPKPESPDLDELSEILYECDENGAPLRCWRDQCRGHWKSPRWAEDLT